MALIRRRRELEPSAADAGDVVLRLAVLLRAGVAPARAWTYLADAGEPVADRVRSALQNGRSAPDALAEEGGAWREVAAAWAIATTVGAPLSETLRGISDALRDAQRTADEVRIVLAEPASTARLMGWLPLVAVGLGAALGIDTVGTLIGTPFGAACLGAGVALMIAARRWTSALVRRARPTRRIPGARAELLAIALGGGVSIERAQSLVAEHVAEEDAGVSDVLALSRSAGVPAVDLLRSSAWLARHRARTEGRLGAAKLATRLLLPLGVCTLPAFLVLGVAPMTLGIVGSGVLVI